MNYRKEIDGLRSIAIIPVILFHAGVPGFPGGYLGVDIFFVISGFLITNILLGNLEKDNFSITLFYEKRCRRILPALFFMLTVTTLFSWLFLNPSQFKSYSQSLFAVGSFSSNILFWLDSGYFDASAELKPLLHTWSLGVEEQYYIVAPLILYAAFKLGRLWIYVTFAGLMIASLGLAEYVYTFDVNANFYLLPTRAWEMAIGSLAAVLDRHIQFNARNLIASIGLAATALPLFLFDQHTPTPSLLTLIPVCGVALILLFGREQSYVAKLLSKRPLVWIGLLSYSAYLWHQPLFAFSRITTFEEPSLLWFATMIGLTFILAYFSWRYVEAPFRDKAIMPARAIIQFSVIGLACCLCVGLLGHLYPHKLSLGTFNPLYVSLHKYESDNVQLRRESWSILREITADDGYKYTNNAADQTLWFNENDNRPRILVVGNSHSKDMFNILHFSNFNDSYQLARYGEQIRELVDTHAFYNSPNYANADIIFISTQFNREDLLNLNNVISRIQKDYKIVVIANGVSEFEDFSHGNATLSDRIIVENHEALTLNELTSLVNEKYFFEHQNSDKNKKIRAINTEIKTIVDKFENVVVLNRNDYLCDEYQKVCWAVSNNLEKFTYDFTHHTLIGAKHYANIVDSLGWQKAIEAVDYKN
ncbi:MAG: acyltransferase family protein [Pseudomonadota bacterium]|nr:acyltransferase family protein [Pseudomonadota bacterium]